MLLVIDSSVVAKKQRTGLITPRMTGSVVERASSDRGPKATRADLSAFTCNDVDH